ncbi:hypothetical protein MSG28_013943 [Choristoneura fumiferana]|uniref:Uncharacterized protein n=1 Tax=Choristoneura fumiferana TaxID=7141 RepID=A0ACC0KA83_CHOFU|nr:hypothetical protein MSG28_013943 [Choristoneura fumiferana]
MSKRSAEDKIDLYKAKIQKLQQQRFRRVIVYSSSSDSEENSDNGAQNTEEHNDTTSAPPQPDPDAAPESGGDTQNTATPVLEPELAPEMLQALGDPSDDTPAYGPDIHEKLAQRWLPILKKGMPKDAKEQLLKEYSIPGNCKLLRAPTLNAEISAAVAETVRSRDKKIQAKQEQLGLGISAINRAMNTLLTSDDKVQAVKILSDGCRILSDLHFVETQVRTKLITPGLDKAFLSVIQDQDRDETLFGEKLSEKIKASKGGAHLDLPDNDAIPVPVSPPAPRSAANDDNALNECDYHQQTCKNTTVTQDSTSLEDTAYPGCRDALRKAFSSRGTPDVALELMIGSLSKNTLLQYGVTYKSWWQFCQAHKLNPYTATSPNVMLFLTERYNNGDAYGSINNHRSALSLLLSSDLSSDLLIKRLLKGVYKSRPALPKYSSTWDPQLVFNYIENWVPNRELPIEKITKKLVVLLALCTAHRVQTLSLIKLQNIVVGSNGIEVGITDVIKTSAHGREQPVLYLPYFKENRAICPATALEDYIFVTSKLRSELTDNKLILTYRKPHKPASAQSISRWIKQVLGESGVDVATFSAHSTRHAATSTAHASGISLDTIRKAAGWSISSQTFAKFYHRPIKQDEACFAKCVLRRNTS